jgi:hypothetical protein
MANHPSLDEVLRGLPDSAPAGGGGPTAAHPRNPPGVLGVGVPESRCTLEVAGPHRLAWSGRCPFKAVARVQIPLGPLTKVQVTEHPCCPPASQPPLCGAPVARPDEQAVHLADPECRLRTRFSITWRTRSTAHGKPVRAPKGGKIGSLSNRMRIRVKLSGPKISGRNRRFRKALPSAQRR